MNWKNRLLFEKFSINLERFSAEDRPKALDEEMIKAEMRLATKTVKGNHPLAFIVSQALLNEFKASSLWTNTIKVNIIGQGPDIVNEFGNECEGFYKEATVYFSEDIPNGEGYLIGNCTGISHGPGVLRLVLESHIEEKPKVKMTLSHKELAMLLDFPGYNTKLREYLLEKDLGFWGKAGFFRRYSWDHFSIEELQEIYQAIRD